MARKKKDFLDQSEPQALTKAVTQLYPPKVDGRKVGVGIDLDGIVIHNRPPKIPKLYHETVTTLTGMKSND